MTLFDVSMAIEIVYFNNLALFTRSRLKSSKITFPHFLFLLRLRRDFLTGIVPFKRILN